MAQAIVQIKRCCTCKMSKPVDQFWKQRKSKDGYQLACIVCCKKAKAKWYAKDPDHARRLMREGMQRHLATKHGAQERRNTQASEAYKLYQRKYHREYYHRKLKVSGKSKARDCVGGAIRQGILPPARTLLCHACGSAAESYHHHKGYDPENHLEVIPLCRRCHVKADLRYVQPCGAGVGSHVDVQG